MAASTPSLDAHKLGELAGRVWALLNEFELDTTLFTLSAQVTPQHFDAIKQNFPELLEGETIIEIGGDNWHINLMRSPFDRNQV